MPRFGMRAPGFMWLGFSIHLTRLADVDGMRLPAKVLRLAEGQGSGRICPADTPPMVWQPTHVDFAKSSLPCWASASVDSTGGASCALTHSSNSPLGWTMTRNRMLACEIPQYSAHCPGYSVACAGTS